MRGDGPAEIGEGVRVASQPCILLHVQRRLDVGHPAEGQAGHEQVDLRHLARGGVDEPHRRSRPVDLHGATRLAPDAARHLGPRRELPAALAEAVVGHRRLALGGRLVAALGMEPLERDADAGELAVHAVPFGVGIDGSVVHALGEEQRVGLAVGHPLDVLPGDPSPVGGMERVHHTGLRDPLRPGYRVSRQS